MKKLFSCLLIIGSFFAEAQEKNYKNEFVNRRSLGFTVQRGIPYYDLPEGKPYYLSGLTANFHQPFFKTKKHVNIGLDIIPEIWLAYAHTVSEELGLNATLNLDIQIKKSLLSFHAGSGFHFFGMQTEKQAKGFAFANNFYLQYKRTIVTEKNKTFDIGFLSGFRHLSNLNTKRPNGGINNIMIGFCFDRVF